MNKFLILTLIPLFSYSQEKCLSKDDFKKYYFINGIQNSESEASNSAFLIGQKFETNSEVELIYNKSESFYKDVIETFTLKSIENKSKNRKEFVKNLEDEKEIKNDISNYLSRLDKNKQNFLFAHSEGNLFANFMCEMKEEKTKLDVVSLATPSDYKKCNLNDKFALFENDFVITFGNFKPPFLKKFSPNYKSDTVIKKDGRGVSIEILKHSLELYLSNKKIVKDLKEKLDKTEKELYEKYYSFNLATIEIEENNKLETLLNQAEDTKDSMSLWFREKQAFLNLMTYSSDLASNLNKKDFIKKILDTPIPAETEQDFADMIAYTLNSLNSYCKKVFPSQLQPLCKDVGVLNYFKSQDVLEPELTYLEYKDYKFMVPCSVASESLDKKMKIYLTYEKRPPTVLFNQKKIDYPIQDKKLISNQFLGKISFQKENEVVVSSFIKSEDFTENESNIKKNQDRMSQCNTLYKLASKNCSSFLNYLKTTYFKSNH